MRHTPGDSFLCAADGMKKYLKYLVSFIILVILSWLPLVGAYDYEAALCTALLAIILVPVLSPKNTQKTARGLAMTILCPIAYWIAANAVMILTALIRGELCCFSQGLEYQLFLAFPGVMLASLVWGWAGRVSRFAFVQIALYILAVALDFGLTFYALYNWPPLISFGQFYGFFAGSIYDESIDVFQALVLWRIGTASLCLCLFFAQTPKAKWLRQWGMPFLGILIAAGCHYYLAQAEIITPIGREALEQTLWQTVGNDKFTVHFVPKSKSRRALNEEKYRILNAFHRDYDDLKAFYQTEPAEPFDVWIYPNLELKGKFLGAKNTSFARIWKNEIHLLRSAPDSTIPKHEMAHLFAGSFGLKPLRLAGGYHIPAMGWVEGLAMAAEWPVQTYDLHTWSAAILERRDLYKDITPHDIIYGFWGLPSRVAYTLAGSWVRWLIENYGIEKVKKLSQGMPGDFDDIIGLDFNGAFNAWKRDLQKYYQRPDAVKMVDLVFGAASIWSKHCARYNAALNAAWYDCIENETCSLVNSAPSVTTCSDNCSDSDVPTLQDLDKLYYFYLARGPADDSVPHAVNHLYQFDSVKNAVSMALPFAQNHLKHDSNSLVNSSSAQLRTLMFSMLEQIDSASWPAAARVIWQERCADMMFHSGMNMPAAFMYEAILAQNLPNGMKRRILIKKQAASTMQTAVSKDVFKWFFTDENKTYIAENHKSDHVIAYLDFVNAMNEADYRRAHRALTRILTSIYRQNKASQLPDECRAELLRWFKYL